MKFSTKYMWELYKRLKELFWPPLLIELKILNIEFISKLLKYIIMQAVCIKLSWPF
jgi:hypothetical protein